MKTNQKGCLYRRQITAVLPVAGQKFSEIIRCIFGKVCSILYVLSINSYFAMFCGTLVGKRWLGTKLGAT
jgi:hypothetical protein